MEVQKTNHDAKGSAIMLHNQAALQQCSVWYAIQNF